MFGSIEVRTRPIRLAYLIDPGNAKHVRDAMQMSSSLWGGSYYPIIPLYKQMPRSWRDGPLRAPVARQVVLGYVDAFDPDILVQYAAEVPSYVSDLGLSIVKPAEIWESLDEERYPPVACRPPHHSTAGTTTEDLFRDSLGPRCPVGITTEGRLNPCPSWRYAGCARNGPLTRNATSAEGAILLTTARTSLRSRSES